MHVAELWRYPVKSLQGERLPSVEVGPLGLQGDRSWALVDDRTGLTLTARRQPELLFAAASLAPDGAAVIALPDGTVDATDAEISAWLGHPVHRQAAEPERHGTYEIALALEDEEQAEWVSWDGPEGSFHDSTRARVSLASTATMRDWDPRRFRMNVLVEADGEDEDDLVGRRVRVGAMEMDVVKLIDRCVMTTRPQPGGIERDLDVLKTINAERAGNLGIGGLVTTAGVVVPGDAVTAVG